MEKLYALTTFLKMTGGKMHTSHPIPLDPPLAIITFIIKGRWCQRN